MSTKTDGLNWFAYARVDKYAPEVVEELTRFLGYEPKMADFQANSADAFGVVEAPGNLLTTAGLNRIGNLIVGSGAAAFNNAQAITGVGSNPGVTIAAVGNTALNGDGSTSTAYYQGADASNPTQSNGLITNVNTFSISNANFAWNEWCWGVATGSITPGGTFGSVGTTPVLLNRKVPGSSLGTKASGAVWVLTTTVQLV